MLSFSCISTEHYVVSWKALEKAQRQREKSWIVQSMSSGGSATLRSFIDLAFTKQDATANGDIRISFFPACPEKSKSAEICVLSGRKTAAPPLTARLHALVGVFHWHICSFLGAIFERVGREDVVSAPDFTLSSVGRVEFRYMEQAAEKKIRFAPE